MNWVALLLQTLPQAYLTSKKDLKEFHLMVDGKMKVPWMEWHFSCRCFDDLHVHTIHTLLNHHDHQRRDPACMSFTYLCTLLRNNERCWGDLFTHYELKAYLTSKRDLKENGMKNKKLPVLKYLKDLEFRIFSDPSNGCYAIPDVSILFYIHAIVSPAFLFLQLVVLHSCIAPFLRVCFKTTHIWYWSIP